MLKKRRVRNPRKEKLTFGLLVLGVVAIFFSVLNYQTAKRYQNSDEVVVGPLMFNLKMPRLTYSEGDAVPIRLSVTNLSRDDVTVKFESDLEFDFVVKRDVNLVFATVPFHVWTYSASHPGAVKPHERTIKPGATLDYSTSWAQVNSQGTAVGPGRYVIQGVINLAGNKQILEIRGGTQ